MRHRKATWKEAKVSENHQSRAVNTMELDQPVPRQGHMGRLQGEWHKETKGLWYPLRIAGWKWNLGSEARSIQADLHGVQQQKFKIFAHKLADKPLGVPNVWARP